MNYSLLRGMVVLSCIVVCPLAAQQRPVQLLQSRAIPELLTAEPGASTWSQPSVPISFDVRFQSAEHQNWWGRHPVMAGAVVGVALGLGFWVYEYRRDDYCRDPDFLPCEFGIPIRALEGAAVGASVGWVAGKLSSDIQAERQTFMGEFGWAGSRQIPRHRKR